MKTNIFDKECLIDDWIATLAGWSWVMYVKKLLDFSKRGNLFTNNILVEKTKKQLFLSWIFIRSKKFEYKNLNENLLC